MTLNNKNTTGALISIALMALMGGFLLFASQVSAATGINKQINFQGKVVNADGTNVANGNYDFVFKLYSVDTAGTAIWTETRTGGNQVTVTDGVFQVNLGSVTALPGSVDFNTDNIYLGVTFHTDSEMTPRVRFTAVPYAFNADKIHGLTVTDTTGTLTIANGKTVSFADAFTTTGAFPLTLTATASTTATLPTGTITLADLATGQTLTNKIIGSTGLTFTGATTDITTGTGEDLTITANGGGIISLNDSVTASGTITANGGISLTGGQSMTAGALSYMDLGSIVHNTTALQGLRLPQAASATPSNPTSGEGYLAWDAAGNQLITYNGSAWAAVGGGGMSIGGSITSATEGSILFAGAAGVLAQDNANFFWDDTNNRLGLGDATPDSVFDTNLTSTNATAATEYGMTNTVSDTGVVTAGTDNTYGNYTSVTRTGATGGTINTYGEYISVTGDAGGASTNTGLYVTVAGADTNYAASFQGGPVLIGPGSFYVNSNNSMVVGTSNTISAGSSATAIGRSNTASFDQTVAVGYSNTASSFYSIAMGNGNSATTSNYATAIGVSNAASGTNSMAIGYDNTVTASGASAFGSGITNGTADSTMIGPNDSAKMTILSSGYVGIGDTTPDAVLDTNLTSTSTTAATEYGSTVTVSDTGVVTTGTDTTYGNYISVTRTGATGGTASINNYGQYITLTGDTGGISTNYGLYVDVSGATNNVPAVFSGGQTRFSDGTAGVPGIGFIGGSGDGMYHPALRELAFSTFAQERVRIDSTGRVGIGDTTPDNPLDITSTSTQIRLSYTDGSVDGTIGVDSNEYLTLQAGTSAEIKRVQIGAGGAGSTTPDFLGLDVKSDTGDPAGGFEGAMYYNTFDNKFRCYQGAAWTDCVASGMAIGNAITSATEGSILFAGAAGVLAQDNANFFWDDTNNRLGLGDATPDSVLDVNLASTSGTAGDEYAQTIVLSDTGAVSSGTDNTYGQYINVARTGATGGTLKTYGTYTTLNSAFTSGSGTAYGYGDYISLTGSTTGNNFLHGSAVYIGGATDFSNGYYAELTSTGQNTGFETAITTGGSTSSNQIGFKASVTDGYSAANSFWGAQITTHQTGALSGTETAYGVDISVQNTGSSGATANTYGGKIAIGADNAGAGVSTGYGLYVDTSNAGASSVNADTTYALYALTKANSGTTAYGAYVDAGTGAGTEYSGIFLNGNFGIGDATPAALFTVGTSDAFQVNNSGTVSIATGQAYTGAGAVTLSSGGSSGLTIDSASGVTTVATGDYLALSHSGVSGAAAGYFWYDSSDNKFKINENGTTKVLCNTTDLGCGAGGSTSWDTIGDAAAAGAIAMNEYAQTMDWNTASTAAAFDGLTITLTNDAATDSNTQRAMVVANQNDSTSTGTTEAIMAVVNRDTDETVGSGLVVENTGTGTMTNAIEILETAGTITTAINIGNGVTTGISIGTGVTTGISIASGGITSTGEVLFTNTGTGLSLRVNDEAADTTPMVVDAAGNVGIGTTAPNRILDIVQAASAPQLRLSKDLTYYSEFTVDSVGDLQVAAVGGDIRALSENVWVCDNDACPALTLTGEGNIFVENVLKFGNGVYIKNDSATELSVYDNDDQAMLIFDEL